MKKKTRASKLPDLDLKAMDIETRRSSLVGAGWFNDDGSISLKLSHCVVLNANEPIRLTLFPRDKPTAKRKKKPVRCCPKEKRSMNGGCLNCGDPCI